MAGSEDQLRDYMRRAQEGDKAAYHALLTGCEKWLRRYFTHKIAPGLLDDLVQETLISIHRKRATYDPERPFLPWLAAIGRYRWIDQLRKIYRADEVELQDEFVAAPQDDTLIAHLSLERLLAQIPHAQALAIRLVKIQGLSIIEAAAQTGQTESLVKVNIHRGIKRMNGLVDV